MRLHYSGQYYVPANFDADNSNRVCLENRPYYTIELGGVVQLNVGTIANGRTYYIYIVVGYTREPGTGFVEMDAQIQLGDATPVQVELYHHASRSDVNEAQYGENYQYYTIGTDLIAG